MQINGIHHVTAIAGPARRNLDFYGRVLGLRLVKKTVNFDDPGTYHLYYGDAAGQPGTILTFFPWEHAAPGRLGVGETQETVFRVPEGAIGYWTHRLVAHGVPHDAPVKRFGETVLSFRDPDGMRLAFVGLPGIEGEPAWDERHPGRACDPRLPQRQPAAGGRGADGGDPDRCLRLRRGRPRGHADPLQGRGRSARQCRRPARRRRLPAGAPGGRLGAPYRLPRRRRRGAGGDGRAPRRRTTASARPSRRTGTISAPSTSASPAAFSSRSRPIFRASRSTSRRRASARR